MRRLCIIHNPNAGGSSSEETIRQAFTGLAAELTFVSISDHLDLPRDIEVIVAAGGDGTVNAVAQLAYKRRLAMAVLPVGTLNHFAKDVGIPLDIAEAARVAATAEPRPIDCATVNGQLFVNNSSLGVYPDIVRGREQLPDRLGKWPAALIAWYRVAKNMAIQHVTIDADGQHYALRTPLVFVGNNDYHLEQTGISNRDSLTGGTLSIYIIRANSLRTFLRIGFLLLLGKTLQNKDFVELVAPSCTVQSSRRQVHVSLDGEVKQLDTPLQYAIQPGGLNVLL